MPETESPPNVGIRAAWAPPKAYEPYGEPARDRIYDLLFADDGASFVATGIAFGPDAGQDGLQVLAFDAAAESRIRALAFRSLRAVGWAPTEAEPLPLLGVIVEIGMPEGLDVLAAYADGRVRYINHAGGMTIIDGPGATDDQVAELLQVSEAVARAIGPSSEARRPPPGVGVLRLSFLVGDELRFGEGPTEVLARDRMGGPVFGAAGRLLARLTELQTS